MKEHEKAEVASITSYCIMALMQFIVLRARLAS